ncbi:MAG: ATP-binding cassette domain-containing protein [Acidobacteria bacterium]|nr:ATP-binding cassette domain-containing protein [Acidobacteriota bacterium]NIM64245.1 ATP-binding cassette domain-containing protein [Acidobacteriota bacterium]NIO59243.1 ATP-binding cassette domain-containing protein [Acidobacteriota bacterium]NIQ30270.1 ATP-binding cassette domain-containing protein [Acidobacteriota bacterium]NIQ85198.1 ATP-binding cassette domain-containing protein [Acidobacteriota bacterium]
MSERLLEAAELSRSFQSGPRRIEVLSNLDLEVDGGESVAIVGDSGVGKSTLLHLLGGLDRPDGGTLTFRGRPLPWSDGEAMGRYRNRHVGFVFQFHHLLPEFNALENVEMPFRIGGRFERTETAAREILERLGLAERLGHTPARLSGGEQQRVAIARAVAGRPSLVLADEPTGNLDPSTGDRVFGVLRDLQKERGFSLVLATHSERMAAGCDRILHLAGGRLHPLSDSAAATFFGGSGDAE